MGEIFKTDAEVNWIQDGEKIQADVKNRPTKEVLANTVFLKDRFDAGCEEHEFEHYARSEFTADNGEYDSDTGLSSLLMVYGDYRIGEEILVGSTIAVIENINEPDLGATPNPYYKLWVSGIGSSVVSDTRVQSGGKVKSKMVYVPRFTLPVSGWDINYPTIVLHLGGFWIDKYECSMPDASDTYGGGNDNDRAQPVSKAGLVLWADLKQSEALLLAQQRVILGKTCRMMSIKHFVAVLLFSKLINGSMKGNMLNGRYSEDADSIENYGRRDPSVGFDAYKMKRCLTGSGPVTWSHNDTKNGVYDLFGNVREFIDFTINAGVFTYRKHGRMVGNYDSSDSQIYIEFHNDYDTVPSTGSLRIQGNGGWFTKSYTAVVWTTKEVAKFTLSGTLGDSVDDGNYVYQDVEYNVTPDTSRGKVSQAIVPVNGDYYLRANKADVVSNRSGNPFLVGDIIQLGIEQMEVDAVTDQGTYWQLEVSRHYNGQTESVNIGDYFATLNSSISNGGGAGSEYQYGEINYFSSLNDAVYCLIPAAMKASPSDYDFYISYINQRVGIRGGCWEDGFAAPWFIDFMRDGDYSAENIGFRCVFEPDRIEAIE